MKKRMRKLASLMLVGCMTVGLLTGCGSSSGAEVVPKGEGTIEEGSTGTASGGPMYEYIDAGFAQPLDDLLENAEWKDKIMDFCI